MWPDFENEFRGSTLMAGKKSIEKLGGCQIFLLFINIWRPATGMCLHIPIL